MASSCILLGNNGNVKSNTAIAISSSTAATATTTTSNIDSNNTTNLAAALHQQNLSSSMSSSNANKMVRKRSVSDTDLGGGDYHRLYRRPTVQVQQNNSNPNPNTISSSINNPSNLNHSTMLASHSNSNLTSGMSVFSSSSSSYHDHLPLIPPAPPALAPAVCGFSGMPLFPSPSERNISSGGVVQNTSPAVLVPNAMEDDDSTTTAWIDGIIKDLINSWSSTNISIPQLIQNVREIIYPCNAKLAALLEYRLRSLTETALVMDHQHQMDMRSKDGVVVVGSQRQHQHQHQHQPHQQIIHGSTSSHGIRLSGMENPCFTFSDVASSCAPHVVNQYMNWTMANDANQQQFHLQNQNQHQHHSSAASVAIAPHLSLNQAIIQQQQQESSSPQTQTTSGGGAGAKPMTPPPQAQAQAQTQTQTQTPPHPLFFFFSSSRASNLFVMEELESRKEDNQQVLKVLEALKQASLDLQTNPSSLTSSNSPSSPIKALLELETESDNILSNDPHLCNLSHHISSLKSLITKLEQFQQKYSLRSFLHRRVNSHEITKVASSIQSEIQSWIDRETVENLVKFLNTTISEDEKVKLISSFEDRISEGFNRDLQNSILKAKVFTVLESVLCDTKCSKTIRERSGFAIRALVKFNKDVFVGEVLMGSTIRALVSMGSYSSIKILCSLIRLIKSPLVDEIEIPKIKTFLNSEDLLIKVAALDCLLDIGYFGRKDTIQAMFDEGLVEKLVELQRSELGGDLIDMGNFEEENLRHGVDCKEMGKKEESRERRFLERKPFASCVARFAIQLEVGEGLRQREKRGYKQEVLKCVRKACIDDAEASAILAEVLWGSSP